jgi:hypothetical protein
MPAFPSGLAGFFMHRRKQMLSFKSESDLQQLHQNDPAYPIISDLVQRLIVECPDSAHPYDPDAHGFISLIEEQDMDRVIHEIWEDWTLLDIHWEGVVARDNYYIAVFLANNEWGWVAVIEDTDWLDAELRDILTEHLDP